VNLLEAWRLSQKLRARPSELYYVTDPLAAFLFDRAVTRFGSALDRDLEAVEGNGKQKTMGQQMVLSRWLGEEIRTGFRTPTPTR
jgi:hypothetical protein